MIEQMDGSYDNPFKFNAKELDEDTGLYYYGARYYNPRLSIWYGVDPLAVYNPVAETQFYGDGQHNGGVYFGGNLNPYAYTYQNPVAYIDPNGKQSLTWALEGSRGIQVLGTGGGFASGLAGGIFAGAIIITYKGWEQQQKFMAQRAYEFNMLSKEQQDAQIIKESFPAFKKEGLITRDLPAAIPQKIKILNANGGERKVPIPGKSGKDGAKDAPGWAKATGERPYVDESGKDFSTRLMDEQYGEGEWNKTKADTGPKSEYQGIKKWGDRSFQNPPQKK